MIKNIDVKRNNKYIQGEKKRKKKVTNEMFVKDIDILYP